MSLRQSGGWVLITRISYECTWVITGLLPKRLYWSMLSLWTVSNGFRLCSPIKASFGTNNIFLWFFSRVIFTYHSMTDISLLVLWLVISDISQFKTLWCMASLDSKAGLLPKRLYQSMFSLWLVSNGFRLCSPIKASFVSNNLFLWFFSQVISTYHPRTDK